MSMCHHLLLWSFKGFGRGGRVGVKCQFSHCDTRPFCTLAFPSIWPGRGACITSCAGGRHNMPPPLQADLWPFDLESGVRVTYDMGYLCANFTLPRPLCSRLRPDVRDRQTSDAHHRLMPAYPRGGGIIINQLQCRTRCKPIRDHLRYICFAL